MLAGIKSKLQDTLPAQAMRLTRTFPRTVHISPQKLHVGDLVDIAFSMVAFGKGNELKARLLLCNIMLLNATHTQVSCKKAGEQCQNSP